jgi:type I restriction enzyme S subunit
LEGLEASEVMLSELKMENEELRLNSEYYSKINIELNNQLDTVGFKTIEEFAFVTDGIHTAIPYDDESNVKLVSATSPRENYFDFSRNAFISEKAHLENPRTALKEDDIILSTVGTIGNCAVVTPSVLPANSDRHVGIIRIKDKFLPNYVSTFLLSKYGRFQTLRESTGNVQLNLFIYKIKTLKIADLSLEIQKKIDNRVKVAYTKREQSQSLYMQAEALLMETIGLKDFQPSRENKNIKTFKESFLETGRLDAEYYQPKYEEVENIIRNYSNGYSLIKEKFKQNKQTIDYSKKQYYYTEIGDVNIGDSSFVYNLINRDDLPDNAKIKSERNDVLISKVRPNRGAVAIIDEGIQDFVVSGAFTVLKECGNYKKEALFVLLKTDVYKEWLLKYNVGTSYPVIRDNDILNLPIPLVDISVQRQIADLINKSFALRKESEQLLDETKNMVEKEIEQNAIGASE